MAEHGVLKNAYVKINTVDLSDKVREIHCPQSIAANPDTVMGDDTESHAPGLANWTVTLVFNQDFSSAKVDVTIAAAIAAGTFDIEIRADTGAVSATNPKWTGSGMITEYDAVGGAIGDHLIAPLTIVPGGATPTLTRGTS